MIRVAPGADASVGCGNALAASAELQPAPAGLALLARAEEHYNSALQSEEDAGVCSQLAHMRTSFCSLLSIVVDVHGQLPPSKFGRKCHFFECRFDIGHIPLKAMRATP